MTTMLQPRNGRPATSDPAVGSTAWLGVRSNKNRCLTMRTSTHKVSTYERHHSSSRSQTRRNHNPVLRQATVGTQTRGRASADTQAGKLHMPPGGLLDGPMGKQEERQTQQNPQPMNKCPKCGHTWPDTKRASGGKARWRGLTKKQRSQAASDAAKARWARTPNDQAHARPNNP